MIRPVGPAAPTRPRITRRRAGALLVAALIGMAGPGCARDRAPITPTTLGTDLSRLPRGRMTPQPLPGNDLARAIPRGGRPAPLDPDAATASGVHPAH